jgi:hypothetical protein
MVAEMPLYPETLFSELYIGSIGFTKIAFSKAEVVYGVQKIGLTGTIWPTESDDPFPEVQILASIVLELGQVKGCQLQAWHWHEGSKLGHK